MKLSAYDLKKSYRQWKSSLGPFECFMRSGPFVSLQTYEDFEINVQVSEAENDKALDALAKQIATYEMAETFVVVDLPLERLLPLAYLLNNRHGLKGTLNLNFLFHTHGLVGSRRSIMQLLVYGEALVAPAKHCMVMLLDHDRYGEVSEDDYRLRLNNQYEVGDDDLPEQWMLRQLGVKRVLWVTTEEKADLRPYMEDLEKTLILERRHVDGCV
ncbi:MAG: hypothetical protein ACRCW2_06800 [Cellulosilyticaceae bacterium]